MKRQTRLGFTLVELLVVMSLIALLATIAIAFFPNAASAAREARAAQTLQQWLNVAKQRAMRDQAPRGLRLWIRASNFTPGIESVYTPSAWVPGTNYVLLDAVLVGTVSYRCTVAHVANPANQPGSAFGANFWMQTQLVTECQYIEQPDDFPNSQGNRAFSQVPPTGPGPLRGAPTFIYNNFNTIKFVDASGAGLDLTNGNIAANGKVSLLTLPQAPFGYPAPYQAGPPNAQHQPGANPDANAKFWSVQPEDYLELAGSGLMHRIVQIGVPDTFFTNTTLPTMTGTKNYNYVFINPPLPFALPVTGTTNFRVLRAPRVVGDETLKLPENTFVDLDTNAIFKNPTPPLNPFGIAAASAESGFVDILFAPNGAVISKGVSTNNIHLWVRSAAQDQPANVFRGDPTIVSVFAKSGFVGAYSPDPVTAGNPYTLVK
jgi:prepilin-type N-terminal cleavage/methylation domain-containing protein